MLKRAVVVALALSMAGCSSLKWPQKEEKGEITLNWYCQKNAEDGSQRCEKRRMRNGKPVDDVVQETMVIPNGKAPPAVAQPAPNVQPAPAPPPSAGQAVAWSRQPVTAVNSIDEGDLEVENLGPELRQTKNNVNLWEKLHGKKAAPAPAPAVPAPAAQVQAKQQLPVQQAASQQPSAQQASNPQVPNPQAPSPQAQPKLQGYTVQLAAFATKDQCETFLSNKKYQGLPLYQKRIVNEGKPWWIVAHGEFLSYQEAESKASQLARQHAGIKPWARSWAVIQALEKP